MAKCRDCESDPCRCNVPFSPYARATPPSELVDRTGQFELRQMVLEIDKRGEGLTPFERDLIANMVDNYLPTERYISTKQGHIIRRIHLRKVN